MAARGMRVTVASDTVHDPDAKLRGVELVAIPPRPRSRRALVRMTLAVLIRSPLRLVRLLRGVTRASPVLRRRSGGTAGLLARCLPLARFRPDIVHIEWHGAAVDLLPLFDAWGCPVVTSFRGSDIAVYPHVPGRESYASCLPEVMRRASAVHCVAEALKRQAIEFGLDPDKARVIRAANDPELFRPAGSPNGRDAGALRAVSVGWLRWEKGYEYALEALRRLLDGGVPIQLDIIGSVPEEWQGRSGERERILHTVADLELDDHVSLHGHLSSAEVSRHLQASDVLIQASVTEGIPNTILEAMGCGVAVVATNCGGIPEAISDGVEGLLVPPRDPEALAQALQRLWSDPDLRRRMGEAGRKRVLAGFSLERQQEAFFDLYREVVGT